MPVKDLKRSELHDLHSVLRRSLERAERNKDEALAKKLASEVLALAIELELAR